jgi:hypothetical protein
MVILLAPGTQLPPHKILGNLYYVGTHSLGSSLIATREGHVLINTHLEVFRAFHAAWTAARGLCYD